MKARIVPLASGQSGQRRPAASETPLYSFQLPGSAAEVGLQARALRAAGCSEPKDTGWPG